MWGRSKKAAVCKPGSRLLPETKHSGSHQEANLPTPWPWPSQPPELGELSVCCLSHLVSGIFYDNLSRLGSSVSPHPLSCRLRIPFVPQTAGSLRAAGTSLIVHAQNTGLSNAFHRRFWNEWGKEKSVWINMCLQEMEFELSLERWILIAMGRRKGMNRDPNKGKDRDEWVARGELEKWEGWTSFV